MSLPLIVVAVLPLLSLSPLSWPLVVLPSSSHHATATLQIYCPSPSPSLFSPRRHYSASLAHRSHSTPLVRLILLPLRPPDLPARRGPSPSLPPPSRFAHSLSPPPAVGPPCQNHCRRPREASASRASREERRKGEGEGESGRGDVWLFIILLCGSRRGSDRFNTLEQNTSIVDHAYVA